MSTAHKWQLLHDYLLETGLVTADQLRIHGLTDVVTPGGEDAKGRVGFASRYLCAVRITDFNADTNALKFELSRWIAHYQPEQLNTEAFVMRIDPVNRDVVNLYIELDMTERGSFDRATGESVLCVQMMDTLDLLPPLDPITVTTQEKVDGQPVTA